MTDDTDTPPEGRAITIEPPQSAALTSSIPPFLAETFEEAMTFLTTIPAGIDPRALVARVFSQPFVVPGEKNISVDIPAVLQAGKAGGNEIELPDGLGVMNKVTPEMLLAIIATIIATSTDATAACVRIRQEVSSWAFQGADGVVR